MEGIVPRFIFLDEGFPSSSVEGWFMTLAVVIYTMGWWFFGFFTLGITVGI